MVGELVETEPEEVHEHDLGHGSQPAQGGARPPPPRWPVPRWACRGPGRRRTWRRGPWSPRRPRCRRCPRRAGPPGRSDARASSSARVMAERTLISTGPSGAVPFTAAFAVPLAACRVGATTSVSTSSAPGSGSSSTSASVVAATVARTGLDARRRPRRRAGRARRGRGGSGPGARASRPLRARWDRHRSCGRRRRGRRAGRSPPPPVSAPPPPGPGPRRLPPRREDGHGVVAVDGHAGHAVGGGALGPRGRRGGDRRRRCARRSRCSGRGRSPGAPTPRRGWRLRGRRRCWWRRRRTRPP